MRFLTVFELNSSTSFVWFCAKNFWRICDGHHGFGRKNPSKYPRLFCSHIFGPGEKIDRERRQVHLSEVWNSVWNQMCAGTWPVFYILQRERRSPQSTWNCEHDYRLANTPEFYQIFQKFASERNVEIEITSMPVYSYNFRHIRVEHPSSVFKIFKPIRK